MIYIGKDSADKIPDMNKIYLGDELLFEKIVNPNLLSFEFTGGSLKYKINNTEYTATTSPYSVIIDDLGVTEFTSAESMFQSAFDLKKINHLPNTSNVTNMYNMFYFCTSLTTLDLSYLDTSQVTNMNYMFNKCIGLQSLNLSNLDMSNVTDMRDMFNGCSSLQNLDLSNVDTSNVTKMNYMFFCCRKIV